MAKREDFLLTIKTFSEVTEKIHDEIIKTKATKKEVMTADLLLEETFMRITENSGVPQIRVLLRKKFGSLSLQLEYGGKEYNPLVELNEYSEDDEDYFRTVILKSYRSKMSFSHYAQKNIVTIQFHDASNKQIYYTLFGMFAGVIFGLILKSIDAPEITAFFDETLAKSFRTMFLNALNMMIAPVIFFSVISGVTSITNAAEVGRIGGKLMGIYTVTTLFASALSVGIGYLLFSGEVPQIGTIENSDAAQSQSISVLSMIVGLIPKNLVNPIVNGEMLQIIFVAIFFGICINGLGSKVKILNDFIEAMNSFCLNSIRLIVKVIPVIAFFAMMSLIINIGLDSVLLLGKLIFGQLGGSFLMVGVYASLLIFLGKISPIPFLKKIGGFIAIPLSTSSSNATMPFTMNFCTNKMGIAPKLSSFSIPIGATVNMDGGCLYLSIASIMLARMYGIELTPDILFTVFVTVVALSVGAPGVPGGAFVCLASIVMALGIPSDATAIILGIDPICSMMRTALNCTGDIAASTALACSENLIEKNIYLKK